MNNHEVRSISSQRRFSKSVNAEDRLMFTGKKLLAQVMGKVVTIKVSFKTAEITGLNTYQTLLLIYSCFFMIFSLFLTILKALFISIVLNSEICTVIFQLIDP